MTPDVTAPLEALRRAIRDGRPADLPQLAAALSALTTEATLAAAGRASQRDGASPLPDENLSTQEAARRLGVSGHWLYRNAKRLPFAVRIGRRLLFSARGLERWNQQRQGR